MRAAARRIASMLLLLPAASAAVQIGALETRWDWDLTALRFVGAEALPPSTLREVFQTLPRPWYAPWRSLPPFDPSTFEADVTRMLQLYRSRGYYRARVGYDLELPAEGTHLVAVVYIDEDRPLAVTTVAIDGDAPEELRLLVPLEAGDRFTEHAYREGESRLLAALRERGFARAKVTRAAIVDVDQDRVDVRYQLERGLPCRFGESEIRGTEKVSAAVVRREITFAPSAPFQASLLETTRSRLAALNLFRTIRVEEVAGTSDQVDIRVVVHEAAPRDIRLGLGYDTEEQVRALASWRDYNFLGDARQLGVTARASFLRYTLVGDFLQPHTPTPRSRLRLIGLAQREEEAGYRLDRARLLGRAEWEPSPWFTTYLFYRLEYDRLSQVPAAVAVALPNAVPGEALQSSLGLGLEFSFVDEPADPGRGFTLKGSVEPVGGVLGGTVGFVRFAGEGRTWIPLPMDSLAAVRVRLGTTTPTAGSRDVPLYERFYAGGTNSLRGYDRRRAGPRAGNDPLGGRTLTEVSVEFRHHFTATLTGVTFFDAAQVSPDAPRPSLRGFQVGTGLGARYRSPVGPIQLDLGIPLDRQVGDARWQLHFSLGAAF